MNCFVIQKYLVIFLKMQTQIYQVTFVTQLAPSSRWLLLFILLSLKGVSVTYCIPHVSATCIELYKNNLVFVPH